LTTRLLMWPIHNFLKMSGIVALATNPSLTWPQATHTHFSSTYPPNPLTNLATHPSSLRVDSDATELRVTNLCSGSVNISKDPDPKEHSTTDPDHTWTFLWPPIEKKNFKWVVS